MYLVTGGLSEFGEPFHVFVEQPPRGVLIPPGCRVVSGVKLVAHPLPNDPYAPTASTVLYRDPSDPTSYHYLLTRDKAFLYERVAAAPFVYPTWEEFARYHPGEVVRMSG